MQTRLRSKVTLLFMMLGLLVAVPTVAFAAQTRTVDAEDSVTNTSIFVPAGSTVRIAAEGTVNLTTDQTSCLYGVGPNGVGTACYDPTGDLEFTAPNLPAGALIGRIGSGDWFLVGESKTISVQNAGQLFLTVNDRDTVAGRLDNSGSFSAEIRVDTPDTLGPRVISTVPSAGATGLGPNANVKANFSEDMRASTINGQTVKLFKKGSTTKVGATVSYNASMDRAILNPNNTLQRGASYKAVVTTGAKDKAGNSLDQNRSLSGLQQKSWAFTISN